ncbi:carbohydrate ABC transporter permease [Paenibacillus sp. OV219]|uniref:carbohydrate ABC transporter permease n=1 Tax=Paenibacillus sp. OV219 TaxID=1884377 RepID=UPI0008C92AF8|nr:carbohydrate ABC transporter permease [Paenibacillus sp. OV219]SEO68010.1 carbohydrate ABC transporter membrane protein 2, CUT1 family [Paenibacillus sp. OV219]
MMSTSEKVQKAIVYFIIACGALFLLVPLWWMITTSIKPYADVFIFPPEVIPSRFRFENYTDIFRILPFGRYFLNTLLIATFVVSGTVFSSAMIGYGFGNLKFPGRNALFIVMLSTMMIPYHTTLVPQFIIFKELGWLDTYLPLIAPAFFGTPFYIFLYRQFFMNIPKEYNDAAKIDGCGYWSTFLRIIIPMSLPVIGVVTIFSFNGVWNDFLGPLIYINSERLRTIQLGINALRGLHTVEWHLLMAASVIALVPTVTIFFLFQRKMIQGVVVSGIKG